MRTMIQQSTAQADRFGITAETMHQYYNTVQSGGHSEHLVDIAMSRRQAMALQAHRHQGRPGWLAVVALLAVAASAIWLFS